MDIIERIFELKIKDTLCNVLNTGVLFGRKKNIAEVQNAKTHLRESCGIIFINIMTETPTSAAVMIKTKKSTIVYDYNKTTKELEIKGERRNVNTK